ncbi:MAG: hypothetical protein ACAI34_15560, partial [Verrucomicrobium sp.]|nr:hypothetical protein [Verrucomicrobium sp.]
HGFMVLFDAAFKVVSYARVDEADYYLSGDALKLGDALIVNFSNHDERTRYKGYLVDGACLEYPFEDRISEADWESGAFRKAK